jgi:hypothetical protein
VAKEPNHNPFDPKPPAPTIAEVVPAAPTSNGIDPKTAALRETHYEVFDLLAVESARTHGPIDRTFYTLSARAPTLIPKAHAIKGFLGDEHYVVRVVATGDADPLTGERVNPMPKVDKNIITGVVILAPGQLVATPEDLTDEALRLRVGQLPGVEPSFVLHGSREEMIAYYCEHDRKVRAKVSNDDDIPVGDPTISPVRRRDVDRLVRVPDLRRAAAV